MNNKDVLITLKSVQKNEKDSDETEIITQGLYTKNEDGYTISYEESSATGFGGSTTILKVVGKEQVTMERTGSTTSNLFIESGKKHHCHYGTPYGDFTVGITTKNITSTLTENGGDLYLNYIVDINSSYVSENEIYVNIK